MQQIKRQGTVMLGKDKFFEVHRNQGIALTYDDVRLITGPSDYSPSEIDITSHFSRNVELKVPIVSAAMDTVTESKMAIAMAKLGGLGVIHAGLSIEEQRREVRRTKLHLNGIVEKPVTISPDIQLREVETMRKQNDFDFRTFPVVNNEGKFIGILTGKDVEYAEDYSKTVAEAMTPATEVITISARHKYDIQAIYDLMRQHKISTLPVLNENGEVASMFVFSDVKRVIAGNPDQYNLDENGRLRVAAAVPTGEDGLARIEAMHKYLDVVVFDSAQGDSKYARQSLRDARKLLDSMRSSIREAKDAFNDIDIVVGNISSPQSVRELVIDEVDGIKVGQGPGSICTTRSETGIGMPQVTAVYEIAREAEKVAYEENRKPIPICADGGITNRGDISIAIAAGAHSVMIGSKLAGTDEAPGKVIYDSGRQVKKYRGMGSPSAIRDSAASRKRYDIEESGVMLAEGVEAIIPYVGSVATVVALQAQALRKSMSYCGAPNIEHHRKHTPFVRITDKGLRESHPHDVYVQ